jgi:hypothetical protein
MGITPKVFLQPPGCVPEQCRDGCNFYFWHEMRPQRLHVDSRLSHDPAFSAKAGTAPYIVENLPGPIVPFPRLKATVRISGLFMDADSIGFPAVIMCNEQVGPLPDMPRPNYRCRLSLGRVESLPQCLLSESSHFPWLTTLNLA